MAGPLAGCATVGTTVGRIVDPFNLTGAGRPPVRIGTTQLELSPLLVPRELLFEENLTFRLGKPVAFELMTARQIRVNLETGRLSFAVLSAGEYCQIGGSEAAQILAVPLNENRLAYRKGLIIVSSRSRVQSLGENKGYRFHSLPVRNPLNDAALGAMLEAGIRQEDLDKGILGLDTSHPNSADVAKSVIMEDRGIGVIDEADYRRWPASGGTVLIPGIPAPSQDQLRIIGETIRVPNGPVVASIHAEPELTRNVQEYLLRVLPKRPLVLASLGFTGFSEPTDPREYAAFCGIYHKLHPPEPNAETPENATETAPTSDGDQPKPTS